MTQAERDRLKELDGKATPGPWSCTQLDECRYSIGPNPERFKMVAITAQGNDKENAELICAMRNHLGELIRDAELWSKLPANWFEDSSVETWFPFTAEELRRTIAERAKLRDALLEIKCQLTGLEGRQYKWIRERAEAALAAPVEGEGE